jgi:nonsense-mediated mRNA decay protein 3
VIPQVVRGFACPVCNRISNNGKSWEDCDGGVADAAVATALRNLSSHSEVSGTSVELSVDDYDKAVFHISGKGSGIYKGVIVKKDLHTEVRLHMTVCTYCSKQHGNYYEAILQIRGLAGLTDGEIDILINRIEDETYSANVKDSNVFITRKEKVRGGYDFYMGEKTFTRQLAQRLHDNYGGEMKTSSSLYGRKDGKDLYRSTYLVRLPGFVTGDYLVLDGIPHLVEKISAKKVQLKNIRNRSRISIDTGDVMGRRMVKREEAEVEAVVIMETGNEIQILDPESLKPRDLIKPRDLEWEGGDKLVCVIVDGEVYIR